MKPITRDANAPTAKMDGQDWYSQRIKARPHGEASGGNPEKDMNYTDGHFQGDRMSLRIPMPNGDEIIVQFPHPLKDQKGYVLTVNGSPIAEFPKISDACEYYNREFK